MGYPDLSGAIQSAKELLLKTEERLLEAYLEEKVEPLIGIVEPSMYAGRFDWYKDLANNDVQPYCKEIIMNMIAVHSEVAQVRLEKLLHCSVHEYCFADMPFSGIANSGKSGEGGCCRAWSAVLLCKAILE